MALMAVGRNVALAGKGSRMNIKRALSPIKNPAGLMAAGLAVYAAITMVMNVVHGDGVIDPQVVVAAVAAVAAVFTRQLVTPVADPRSKNGVRLVQTGAEILKNGPR
jgi:hypothetical protein